MGKAILVFGFDELSLRRVFSFCDDENIRSYRVMEKIGMRREGLYIESRSAHKLSNKNMAMSYPTLFSKMNGELIRKSHITTLRRLFLSDIPMGCITAGTSAMVLTKSIASTAMPSALADSCCLLRKPME